MDEAESNPTETANDFDATFSAITQEPNNLSEVITQEPNDMGEAIAELTRRVVKIRPVMLEMAEQNKYMEKELLLVAKHLSMAEDAAVDLERLLQCLRTSIV